MSMLSGWYKLLNGLLLFESLNWTLSNNKIPPAWKEAAIILIPKEGKNRENCESYRPISILNVDYKIFTSIILKKIEQFLVDLMDENQTVFIKKSDKCEKALSQVSWPFLF